MFYPLLLVILLGVAWSIYWTITFNGIQAGAAMARQNLEAAGARLSCGRETWGGFPFRIEFACEDAELTLRAESRSVRLTAGSIAAVALAYNLRHVLAFIQGPTAIDGLSVSHQPMRISLRNQRNDGFDISVEAPRMAAALPQGLLSADLLRLFARTNAGKLELAADAARINAMGAMIDRAEVLGCTDQGILAAPDPLAEAARNGQTLDIERAEARFGQAWVKAKGTLRLDAARRPQGRITAETNDIDRLLDAIAPAARLTAETREAIASTLAVVAKDPTSKALSAEIVAQDGAAYWGPLKLADLPPLK
jgi:hypothetical protein